MDTRARVCASLGAVLAEGLWAQLAFNILALYLICKDARGVISAATLPNNDVSLEYVIF